MPDFEKVVVETDLLILGGGMAACGAAVEAAHWAKEHGLKVALVDKAAVDRSGAVAMGLSAINQYVGLKDGANSVKDYVEYVRNDLMGVTREDLVANIARHVDSTVHLFEKWGLPIWKDAEGKYVHEGRWQLMINGESYKASRNAGSNIIVSKTDFLISLSFSDGGPVTRGSAFSHNRQKYREPLFEIDDVLVWKLCGSGQAKTATPFKSLAFRDEITQESGCQSRESRIASAARNAPIAAKNTLISVVSCFVIR